MKLRAICENHLYNKAYTKGKRAVSSALAVYVLPDYASKKLQNADTRKQLKNRYGLTVSTKIGGAVIRSRCRRIIREAIRGVEKSYDVKKGFLIVVAARSNTPKMKSTDLKLQLSALLKNLGIISK